MVIRALAVMAALGAAAACTAEGETCGAGRCTQGDCRSVFGSARQEYNDGYTDELTPRVDSEWWCVHDCPADMNCPGQCMEDPADDRRVICSAQQADVSYWAQPMLPYFDAASNCQMLGVTSYGVLEPGTTTVAVTCVPGQSCYFGRVDAGEPMAVELQVTYVGALVGYSIIPTFEGAVYAPDLPEGESIQIYAGYVCPPAM